MRKRDAESLLVALIYCNTIVSSDIGMAGKEETPEEEGKRMSAIKEYTRQTAIWAKSQMMVPVFPSPFKSYRR